MRGGGFEVFCGGVTLNVFEQLANVFDAAKTAQRFELRQRHNHLGLVPGVSVVSVRGAQRNARQVLALETLGGLRPIWVGLNRER